MAATSYTISASRSGLGSVVTTPKGTKTVAVANVGIVKESAGTTPPPSGGGRRQVWVVA